MSETMKDARLKVAVIGSGLMGAGIARLFIDAGHDVAVHDADDSRARQLAEDTGARYAPGVEDAVSGVDVVFEAVAEDEDIKRALFARIGAAEPRAIVTSNTSSIAPEVLSEALPGPHRFAIAHFFNPPGIVPLVEVVPGPATDPAVLDSLVEMLRAVGRAPVLLRRAVPGFVANRLQAALLREAFALEAQGVASFADIDLIVRAGLGSRWAAAGPFTVIDLGGLDVWQAVCARLFPELDASTEAPAALRDRVAAGLLGAKTGEGISRHDKAEDEAVRARIRRHFALEFG